MALRPIYSIGRQNKKERVYRHTDNLYDDNEFRDRDRFLGTVHVK